SAYARTCDRATGNGRAVDRRGMKSRVSKFLDAANHADGLIDRLALAVRGRSHSRNLRLQRLLESGQTLIDVTRAEAAFDRADLADALDHRLVDDRLLNRRGTV